MEKILIFIISFLLLAGQFGYAASPEDLAALERQAKEKEAQLKKYQEQEAKLQKELKNLTQKEKQADLQSVKLSTDIEVFRTQTNRAVEHKTIMEDSLPLWQSVVQKELGNYIVEDILSSKYYGSQENMESLSQAAFIKNHIIFLHKLGSEVKETALKLENFEAKSRQLVAQKDKLETQKQNIRGDYEKKKVDLDDTHQRAEAAAQELKELKESAEQMQAILKEAEARRKREAEQAGTKVTKAAPAVKKNTLMWPVNGKVISKFGKEYHAQLKTWIFRDGIKIAARAGTPVEAVKDGTVIYAGEFRSYGNVVILDHGGGFFTIYGFLSEIKADSGGQLNAGQVLGATGRDSQGAAMGSGADALYFEVRVGTTAEDPLLWLDNQP